ncbi:MAG: lamin tail domain-containing protein, partial [Flavobacteriales bacterium]
MKLLKKIALSLMILSSLNALGQLSDNFSDGDFTNNPSWTGNTSSFLVNGLGQLQLTAPGAGQSTIATSFANTSLGNKEWSFFIRQAFAGSDNNQSRLYLTANGTAMSYTGAGTAGVEGYFLKFGEGGSADAIRLFRDNGIDNPVEIAAATAGAISGSFSVRVKITRDNTGLWTILADYTGGSNLAFQTSISDNTFTSSSAFGWICNYTASNVANFFLDDVYFGNIVVDTNAPELVSATAISSTSVDVLFNEPLNEAAAELTANYTIQGNVNPSSATIDATNTALVHLTFANPFPANTDITLEVTDIEDLNGNTLTSAQTIFNFFIPASANFRDVVFNEILADPTPAVGLPEVEFVELHNHTNEAFNLANWSFVNSTTIKILPSYTLAPGGYVILTDANNTAFFTNSIGITSFTALTNTTDSLTLLDNNGQLIDYVVYDIDWYETTEKANGGWSLELINPTLPCQSASNWSESNNVLGGTPNAINSVYNITTDAIAPTIVSIDIIDNSTVAVQFSETMNSASLELVNINILPFINATSFTWNGTFDQLTFTTTFPLSVGTEYSLIINDLSDCSGNILSENPVPFILGSIPQPGQLRFTEIMADPEPSYGAPNAEYVELYNVSDVVLDISDVTINAGVFTSSVILQPGEYITVANITNAGAFSGIANKAFMLAFPGLSNTGGTITLSHPESGTLDEISYSIDWYNDATKDDGGYSLELINLTIPCTQASNWTASNATIGGTPSAVNSVNSETPDIQNPTLTYAAYSENSNALQLFFSESINNSTFTIDDFVITPSINLLEITQVSSNSVTITTLDNILLNTAYNITFSNIADCSGNVASNGSFIIGRTPEAGEILITEIMAAPSNTVGQYRAEYLEIYNYSPDYIDMSSVTLNNTPFETPFVLAPGEYTTLASLSNANLLTNISNIRFKASFPSLSNAGTELTLGTLLNTVIDFVAYTDQWYQDNSKD